MANPKLTIYLDIISPFAYLAFHLVNTSPIFKPCEVTYIPVFLAGIMKACGNVAPINIKNKDKFISRDRLRWARLYDIPTHKDMPPGFPKNTVSVQRALTAIMLSAPETLAATFSVLYHASFAEHLDVVDKDVLHKLLSKVHGDDGATEIMNKSTTDEVKKALSANTDRALEDGAFGLPWFMATNSKGETKGYWGFDHIGQLADHLGLETPRPGSKSEGGWRAML